MEDQVIAATIRYEVREYPMLNDMYYKVYRVKLDDQERELEAIPGPKYYRNKGQADINASILNFSGTQEEYTAFRKQIEEEDTKRRRSEGAKSGWKIRRLKKRMVQIGLDNIAQRPDDFQPAPTPSLGSIKELG